MAVSLTLIRRRRTQQDAPGPLASASTGRTRRAALKWAVGSVAAACQGIGLSSAAQPLPSSVSPLLPPDRPFGDSIGLGVKFYQGEPVQGLFALRELGVRWVREEHHWASFEPAAGQYRGFTGAFINRLKFYRQHDIGVVFILAYGNGVAYPDTAERPLNSIDPDAFGRYAAEVARRLQAAGVRFALEVWNEPHNGEIQKKVGGSWQGAGPAPWVHHYVKLVKAVRDVARALDPAIPVFSQDDMWICHYWFLEAGLPADLDGFSIHPYQPSPERAAVAHDTDWCRPFQVVDRDGSFRSGVRRLKEQGLEKLGREPRIWITEMGYQAANQGREGGIPAERIAAYVPRSYISAFAAGVEVSCWFSSFDGPDGPMGLRDNRGDKRPAYHAFRTMSEQLKHARLIDQPLGAGGLTAGPQAFRFQQGSEQVMVMWAADDRQHQVMSPGATRVIDLLGGDRPVANGDLVVEEAPIYVHGRWTDEQIASWRLGVRT